MRDEGGDQRMAASPPDAGPVWVRLGGGTHPQKKSMATSPARRMAKRMERMVVMAIMPALCPLPVVEMALVGLAGERAGGEGAAAGIHQGHTPRRGSGGRDGGRCVRVCHHTVPPYGSQTRGTALPQFPQLLTGAQTTVAHHSAPWDHPTRPGPPHNPPRRLWGRTSTPAAVPALSVIGADQSVSATGTEPSRARNFTLRWEGRLVP